MRRPKLACLYFLLCIFSILLMTLFMRSKNRTVNLSGQLPLNGSEIIGNEDIIEAITYDERTIKNASITIKSSADHVYVIINGIMVYEEKGLYGRGIHVVVINPFTLSIMNSQKFDVIIGTTQLQLVEYLKRIQNGLITLFLVKGEASNNLNEIGRKAIESFGSKLIRSLSGHSTWAFCVRKGHKVHLEELNNNNNNNYAIIRTFYIEMQPSIRDASASGKCYLGTTVLEKNQEQFCGKYIGYDTLCSCKAPKSIESPPLKQNRVYNLPITIIASNRPHYLYRMLKTLLLTPGVNQDMITVYIDGFYDETVAVCDFLRVKYVEHSPICTHDKVCRLSQHYKFSLHDTFEKYPEAKYMIIFEEDLEVSPDIMDYFSQLLPVYESDPTVYCLSAWNDHSYPHSTNDPAMLYRVDSMPGLGWMLKRELFQKEFEPVWPDLNYRGDWDLFLRTNKMIKDRSCIIPEISRTFHFGKVGVHINEYYFADNRYKTKLNKRTGITFNVSKMYQEAYNKEIKHLIQESKPLNHSLDPCKDNFIPNTIGSVYTLYIDVGEDFEIWKLIERCFNLWSIDIRGSYKYVLRFWYRQNHIIVVATLSEFFKYKPVGVPVMVLTKNKT